MAAFLALYPRCLWLFLLGGVLGVGIENLWWRLRYGFWQTHVVSIWFPLCSIYGFGAVGCYLGAQLLAGQSAPVRFLVFALVGAAVEFVGGFLLEYGLSMRAWDYSGTRFNLRGYINLTMTLCWGVLGLCFERLVPGLNALFGRMDGPFWNGLCLVLTVLLLCDTLGTALCLLRWSRRHRGVPAKNRLTRHIDRSYPDEWMRHRFNNWHFLDEPDTARTRPVA